MDPRQTNRVIGCVVLVVIAYYLVQILLPYLIMGAIGLVLWRLLTRPRQP